MEWTDSLLLHLQQQLRVASSSFWVWTAMIEWYLLTWLIPQCYQRGGMRSCGGPPPTNSSSESRWIISSGRLSSCVWTVWIWSSKLWSRLSTVLSLHWSSDTISYVLLAVWNVPTFSYPSHSVIVTWGKTEALISAKSNTHLLNAFVDHSMLARMFKLSTSCLSIVPTIHNVYLFSFQKIHNNYLCNISNCKRIVCQFSLISFYFAKPEMV